MGILRGGWQVIKRVLSPLFTTRAAATYILLIALSLATGTFIENDFGTSSAQALVYKSSWFTLLLGLFCITIMVNVVRFRMIPQKKWPLLTFHLAMILILIGSAVTRYTGYEGIMHIRENDVSDRFLSAETYLQFRVKQGEQVYRFDEPVLFSSVGNNDWEGSYLIGNDLLEVGVKEFIPNPVQSMETSLDGRPTIKIVFGGMKGREEYYLSEGDAARYHGVLFNFREGPITDAVNITFHDDSLFIKSDQTLVQRVMATQKVDTLYPQENYHPLTLRALYSDGRNGFVFGDFNKQALVHVSSHDAKVKNESLTALRMEVKVNGVAHEVLVYGQKGVEGRPEVVNTDDLDVGILYGAKEKVLPFSLKLHDFSMERYPGTNSAMSYASEVQLIDDREQMKEDHRIFMNNVLDHDGYRFFQSSFDQDELGTYLSVNHDFWGTWISYIGYAVLTIGMVLTLFSRKSHFRRLGENIAQWRRTGSIAAIAIALCTASSRSQAQKVIDQSQQEHVIDAGHAERFSRIIVQDHAGRMKPMHTLSREVMRKVYRRESINGLTADQVLLGMFASARDWYGLPMVKLGEHKKIHGLLGVPGPMATYKDFFDVNGDYILSGEVRAAMALETADRGTYEKDLLKLDERVNIMNMVFSGMIFKIIPVPGDPNNNWASRRIEGHAQDEVTSPVADRFFDAYAAALGEAMHSGNYALPDKLLSELADYQRDKGAAVIPSPAKVSAEILLNDLDVFDRLALYYFFLGLAFLFLLFFSVFKPQVPLRKVKKVMMVLLLTGLAVHTSGLGLRWYVSGRAPWSNGYESMIYIAWTTVLAGSIFSRKSFGGSAATMILASTVLMVAMLSYLDPEITPLVPVLRSYWLTIHVSMEAGSYGFLALGAVIGLIDLILDDLPVEGQREEGPPRGERDVRAQRDDADRRPFHDQHRHLSRWRLGQ